MGKFTVTNSSEKKIALRFKQSVHEKLAHNWRSVNGDIPEENGKAENYLDDLVQFWDGVKKKNPLWVPFSLGTGDVEELQQEIDRLSRKAKKKETFTEEEKYFLVSFYGWLAWGGLAYPIKWLPEASQLLRHYLHGKTNLLKIDPYIYQTSSIVKYAIAEMKNIILSDIAKSGKIRNNGSFGSPGNLHDCKRTREQQKTMGEIRDNGYLLAEQNNTRLHKADNRFPLYCTTTITNRSPSQFHTIWSVRSVWDYDSFEKQKAAGNNLVTELDLPMPGKKISIPDGLSEYLTKLGLARVFDYYAEWEEKWSQT